MGSANRQWHGPRQWMCVFFDSWLALYGSDIRSLGGLSFSFPRAHLPAAIAEINRASSSPPVQHWRELRVPSPGKRNIHVIQRNGRVVVNQNGIGRRDHGKPTTYVEVLYDDLVALSDALRMHLRLSPFMESDTIARGVADREAQIPPHNGTATPVRVRQNGWEARLHDGAIVLASRTLMATQGAGFSIPLAQAEDVLLLMRQLMETPAYRVWLTTHSPDGAGCAIDAVGKHLVVRYGPSMGRGQMRRVNEYRIPFSDVERIVGRIGEWIDRDKKSAQVRQLPRQKGRGGVPIAENPGNKCYVYGCRRIIHHPTICGRAPKGIIEYG
jgi:hypothetical protein